MVCSEAAATGRGLPARLLNCGGHALGRGFELGGSGAHARDDRLDAVFQVIGHVQKIRAPLLGRALLELHLLFRESLGLDRGLFERLEGLCDLADLVLGVDFDIDAGIACGKRVERADDVGQGR